ncbi:hypothetical protein BpHYR1_034634 [Brachionus plicatilis]|uniref:Uncharacterized protein n=1 Tax=Brachionus plicatilis TaxID=10195 RepID=A0A3M7R6J0_BRAPC|nr:hypothetical protein BpHYR1_034634 [Brachionus plicatilis]
MLSALENAQEIAEQQIEPKGMNNICVESCKPHNLNLKAVLHFVEKNYSFCLPCLNAFKCQNSDLSYLK